MYTYLMDIKINAVETLCTQRWLSNIKRYNIKWQNTLCWNWKHIGTNRLQIVMQIVCMDILSQVEEAKALQSVNMTIYKATHLINPIPLLTIEGNFESVFDEHKTWARDNAYSSQIWK